jgi:polyhydroxyalkanoate synthesis regulator phasin
MLDILKKTVYAGIGATVTTKEQVQKILHEMVEQGKMTRNEAEKMAEKIVEESRKEFESTTNEVHQAVREWWKREKPVSEAELQKLESRIKSLEVKLGNLAKKVNQE